jgi:CBS domain-containing protein
MPHESPTPPTSPDEAEPVSRAIRAACDLPALAGAAHDIRRLARRLLEHGLPARQLTGLVSHLNDVLTAHLVGLLAAEAGMDLGRACWLAFGSEGRSEQTIATDQDNGLVFESDEPGHDRASWLAFGRRVNDALDACGYPLCQGNVMASNPECCLTPAEWRERFEHWMEHGAPRDLLAASIYFDLRPIAGRAELALPLRDAITGGAQRLPRFMKQLADNALSHGPPLTWLGGLDGDRIDLKMQGTALFVDAARLLALAHGIPCTGTRHRFEALAAAGQVPPAEAEVWIGAFEFLQMLRLRVQVGQGADEAGAGAPRGNPNLLDTAALDEPDRHALKEALHVARSLQQRLALDYQR